VLTTTIVPILPNAVKAIAAIASTAKVGLVFMRARNRASLFTKEFITEQHIQLRIAFPT
jgi:hypothetical protein